MSWYAIADKLATTQCFERSRTGRCSHKTKKGINPCNRTQKLIDACSEGFKRDLKPEGVHPETVIEHLASKRCRNKSCNHKGCAEVDNLVTWGMLENMGIAA